MCASRRKTPTLSISLTPELADAIAERVRCGLYTSASELIREALRLFLRTERAQMVQMEHGAGLVADGADRSSPSTRFATTMELVDLGGALRTAKLRHAEDESGVTGKRERLEALEERQETGPGLRVAPERLAKLKLRE